MAFFGGSRGVKPPCERNNLKTLVFKLCSEYTILRYVLPSSNYRMNSDFREVTVAYAILRTAKLKSFGEIGGSLSHNYRTRPTPNADPTRTADNSHSVSKSYLVMDGIKQRLPDKVRSNAVLCLEFLITASPEWSGWQDQKQEADFFKRSVSG